MMMVTMILIKLYDYHHNQVDDNDDVDNQDDEDYDDDNDDDDSNNNNDSMTNDDNIFTTTINNDEIQMGMRKIVIKTSVIITRMKHYL